MNLEFRKVAEEALSRIAKGDETGVELLYSCMGKWMLLIAKGVTGNKEIAEDAVQESFLRITENIDKYEKNTNACAWVCRIVHNTAVNELKKYKGKEYYPIDETEFFSDEESMEKKSESRLLVEQLMKKLDPPILREMICRKYFLDMTVREIAQEIGKSKSYVSKEILKAEKMMKSFL